MRHPFFLARTVMVHNNDVDTACRILNRILGREDIFDQFRRTRYYEKPYQVISLIHKFSLIEIVSTFSLEEELILSVANRFIMKIWLEKYSLF